MLLIGFSTLANAEPGIIGTWYTQASQNGQVITLNTLEQFEADGTATMQAVFPGKKNKVIAKFQIQYGESTYKILKVLSKTNCSDFVFGSFEGYEYSYSITGNVLAVDSLISAPSFATRATTEQIANFAELEEGCN